MISSSDHIRSRTEGLTDHALMALEMFSAADTENKYNLLSIASRALNDLRVLEKWIDLIANETDTNLKAILVQRLNTVTPQQLYSKKEFVDILLANLTEERSRGPIIALLGRQSITDASTRKQLIETYHRQTSNDLQQLILSWLLVNHEIPDDTVEFFVSIFPHTSEEQKQAILVRLLRQNKLSENELRLLLDPSQPAHIRNFVLGYCMDRSLFFEPELCILVTSDVLPENRILAIQLLATQGIQTSESVEVILMALQKDANEDVRREAILVFGYSLTCTTPVIELFIRVLMEEKSYENANLILSILLPHADRNPLLRTGLLEAASKNINTAVATMLYAGLGKLVPLYPEMFRAYIEAYQKDQRTDCKVIILKAITTVSTYTEEQVDLYTEALKAPSLDIQSWGMQGFLQLPLTEANTPFFIPAAEVLVDARLNADKRFLLAEKISRIPAKPPAIIEAFKRIVDHDPDDNLREICREALAQTITQTGADNIDWQQWLYQVDVEHTVNDIFPNLWLHYHSNPGMAKKIFWAALSPACSNSLYKARVSDYIILNFLSMHNGIDDEFCRYCVNKILTDTNDTSPNDYLVILKANRSFPGLSESLWSILEKTYDKMNMLLFKELLEAGYGEQAYVNFEKQMLTKDTPKSIMPYLKCLLNTSIQIDLQKIAQLKIITEDDDNLKIFKEIATNHGLLIEQFIKPAASNSPGFAD